MGHRLRPTRPGAVVVALMAVPGLAGCGAPVGPSGSAAVGRSGSAAVPAVQAAVPAVQAVPAVVAPGGAVPTVVDHDLSGVPARLGPWALVGGTEVLGADSDQGLTTVTGPGGATTVVYRGDLDVTAALRAQGWDHIGAPGSWHGWVVDAFQGRPAAKMFRVTSPAGSVTTAVHPLAAGEQAGNSFAALSPDGRWMVSGEWGVEGRLLVFPTPVLDGGPGPLPLAGTVALDRPVRDVQGCAFADATQLVCTTADPGTDLWPTADQLLDVDLSHPLAAGTDQATVRSWGELPEVSGCRGTYEPEGDSIDPAGRLRVAVVPPGDCALVTRVYEYRRSGGG